MHFETAFVNIGDFKYDFKTKNYFHKLLHKEQFKDTKDVIRICKSKVRQHNGGKRHRTNNDLQNTTQNTKDRATQTQLESEGELGCSGKVSSSGSTSGTRRANLVTNLLISYE